jgi:hypothetical protein
MSKMEPIRLKPVTPKQFNEWLKNNIRFTWFHGEGGGYRQGGVPFIKYFYPKLDTRDMKIFRIDCHPERYTVDFRDVGRGNLLDELDRRLEEDYKYHLKRMEELDD